MRRRAAACIALTTVMLLAVSAVAFGAWYEGGGAEDPRVGVTFAKDGDKVKGFTVRRARFRCSDGSHFRTGTRLGTMTMNHRGRFRGRFTSRRGEALAAVSGAVRKANAKGSLRIVTFVGWKRCSTGDVRWRAQRG